MTDDNLPPLPEPHSTVDLCGHEMNFYTRSQMQAYARAAILAERDGAADIVLQELGDTGQARAIASAIRENS